MFLHIYVVLLTQTLLDVYSGAHLNDSLFCLINAQSPLDTPFVLVLSFCIYIFQLTEMPGNSIGAFSRRL